MRQNMLVDGFDVVVDLDRSHGSFFVDARTGTEYLDFFSCIASMPIGLNHPKMTDPAFVEYLGTVALNKLSNSDIYSEAMATFVKTFFEIAVPKPFVYSFFIEGGALAVENAIKAAIDWKVRKNFRNGWRSERGHKVIHFQGAFHGRSGYTMSLTNTDPTKTDLFPKFDWPRISHPSLQFPISDAEITRVTELEDLAVRQIKNAFQQNPDDIACIVLEPIQGEGGDRYVRKEFLQQLRTLADENQALLIFDEVQTGVGITGHWWAHQEYGVTPDIMVFGKKMQVCGIISTNRIDDVPDNVFHTPSRINSTWGGNLTDMARVTRYLEIIDEEKLVQNAATQGTYLHNKVLELQSKLGNTISNVRGLGLYRAFDLPDTATRNAFLSNVLKQGVIMVGSGQRTVRFRPPLNISSEEINIGIERIAHALS
ncbi:MAG: putative L-lysine-epsilon aminotransferase [Chlorobi bacterium]|nr:putative L-lysine-epsilon aminotransferase [Chlorobiota bacterium]